MPIRVYLLRHAEAEATLGLSDRERALTAAGLASTRAAAATLAGLGLRFERGFTSPVVRAQTTAAIFWQALGAGELAVVDELGPGAEPEAVVALLTAASAGAARRRLLVVGHMPDLAELRRFLANARVPTSLSFPPGGMSCLDFAGAIERGQGTLLWSRTPAELAAVTDPDLA